MEDDGGGLEGLECMGLDKRLLGIPYVYPVVAVVSLMCQLRASRARQREADNKKSRRDGQSRKGSGARPPVVFSHPLFSPFYTPSSTQVGVVVLCHGGIIWAAEPLSSSFCLVSHFAFFCSVVRVAGYEPVTPTF
jgi:hypothetical protein